jgi:hypothetical protein
VGVDAEAVAGDAAGDDRLGDARDLRGQGAAVGVAKDYPERQAILSLIAFFVIGLVLLVPVKVRQAMIDAGQDPSRVVL